MPHGTGHALPLSEPTSVVHIAREGRPTYDTRSSTEDPLAVLIAADRDDILRNLQNAESSLREVFPELVLMLSAVPGAEVVVHDTAQAMGRLSLATRTLEDRIAAAAPGPKHPRT